MRFCNPSRLFTIILSIHLLFIAFCFSEISSEFGFSGVSNDVIGDLLIQTDSSIEMHTSDDLSSQSTAFELENLVKSSPNTALASFYARSLADLDAELSHLKLSHQTNAVFRNDSSSSYSPHISDSPVKLPSPFTAQLRLFASLAAVSYCMSWNILPNWNCGYPRCTDPELTLRALEYPGSPGQNSYPRFFAHLRISDPILLQSDILANTRPVKYIRSSDTSTVGFVATNTLLDGISFHPLLSDVDKKTIIVSFRGSLHPKNFYYDLQVAQIDFDYPSAPVGAKIHSGFWKVWQSCESQVVEVVANIVQKVMEDGNKHHFEIVFTGHSLGGSVSTLGALALRRLALQSQFPGMEETSMKYFGAESDGILQMENAFVTMRVYTFGQPRTGNQIFADWLSGLADVPVFRTTFLNDIIVHLPPRRLSLPEELYQFRHHASEFYIVKSKDTFMCDNVIKSNTTSHENVPPLGEHPSCSDGQRVLSLISHLTYWNVVFGPWC